MRRFIHVALMCLYFVVAEGCALPFNGEENDVLLKNSRASTDCSSKDFVGFLNEFSESVDIQLSCTRFPLDRQRMDIKAEPEPKPILELIEKRDIITPIMPNFAERKLHGLIIRIDTNDKHVAKVSLLKEDTDYLVSYYFLKNQHWELVRVEDWSL